MLVARYMSFYIFESERKGKDRDVENNLIQLLQACNPYNKLIEFRVTATARQSVDLLFWINKKTPQIESSEKPIFQIDTFYSVFHSVSWKLSVGEETF